MAYQFILPDIGEGLTESEILDWRVKPGDSIKEDDILLEVESDKATVEIPSPVSGTVKEIFVAAGQTAKVGQPLIEIETADAVAPPPPAASKHTKAAANGTVAPIAAAAATTTVTAAAPVEPSDTDATNVRVQTTPSVRKFAREHGVILELVPPSGKGNRVTQEDVEKYIAARDAAFADGANAVAGEADAPAAVRPEVAAPAAVESAPSLELEVAAETTSAPAAAKSIVAEPEAAFPETREKLSATRRTIARALVKSVTTAAHVTVLDRVNATNLVAHRSRFKSVAAENGINLTYTAYFVKALVAILQKYPALNASIDDASGELVVKHYFNIGVATDTDHGLCVPVIKNADRKTLFQIAKEVTENGLKAQQGTLTPLDMSHSSMTVSNAGGVATGGVWVTPIINYPESAILAVGRIEEEPVVNAQHEIVVAPILKLSFSFDHRIVDGVSAQHAINDLKTLLADPELIFVRGA
jgi:pyruvate dehydrogenase E2 component (dihydrolipoamide acetyltransferase)